MLPLWPYAFMNLRHYGSTLWLYASVTLCLYGSLPFMALKPPRGSIRVSAFVCGSRFERKKGAGYNQYGHIPLSALVAL